jgi:hypothetical protein
MFGILQQEEILIGNRRLWRRRKIVTVYVNLFRELSYSSHLKKHLRPFFKTKTFETCFFMKKQVETVK